MIAKTLAVLALVAAAQAGGVTYLDHHVGAQSEQTIRGLGYAGLSTLSTQSKAVDSPYSSVRRHETRVHNPTAQLAYAAPAYATQAYAAPAYATQAYAAPAYAAAPSVTYSASPVARVAAPVAYATPAVARVAAPLAVHHAPVARVAQVAHPAGLLGVAYSAVPEVAHLTFDGFGVHYGY